MILAPLGDNDASLFKDGYMHCPYISPLPKQMWDSIKYLNSQNNKAMLPMPPSHSSLTQVNLHCLS